MAATERAKKRLRLHHLLKESKTQATTGLKSASTGAYGETAGALLDRQTLYRAIDEDRGNARRVAPISKDSAAELLGAMLGQVNWAAVGHVSRGTCIRRWSVGFLSLHLQLTDRFTVSLRRKIYPLSLSDIPYITGLHCWAVGTCLTQSHIACTS